MSQLNDLRKEFKNFGILNGERKSQMKFIVEVYSDRAVIGTSKHRFVKDFFQRRGVICTEDRGGWSINKGDAESMGFTTIGTHVIQYSDLRKSA